MEDSKIVSETLKYSDGTETVINFTDPVDQSIPEVSEPEEALEVPVEVAPATDIESGNTETSDIE